MQTVWSGINHCRQEHAEKKLSLRNQKKKSDKLDSLAICLIFFKLKLFSDSFILIEKYQECYRLLHTPQCDKPCHLHLKRGYIWPSLCFQSQFYSVIHCTLAVFPQKYPEKMYTSLESDNPMHAGAS